MQWVTALSHKKLNNQINYFAACIILHNKVVKQHTWKVF